jgi:hypothetical protein
MQCIRHFVYIYFSLTFDGPFDVVFLTTEYDTSKWDMNWHNK